MMKPVLLFLRWLAPFLLTPHYYVRAECYGEPEYDFNTACREQYLDCESCVIGSTLHPSCHGWCPETGMCAGGFADDGITIIQCSDTEVALEDYCAVNTVNPAFDNQQCIAVSWEWYYCNQVVDGVGCDENYVTNYCELREQKSTQLCNGDTIELENPDYPFGGWDLGFFEKNPAGVKVKFGPGEGLYTSGCYKFNYVPIADDYMCAAGDSYALKYTLAFEGPSSPEPAPTDPPQTSAPRATPVTPPVFPPTQPPTPSPAPQSAPVSPPVSLPTQPSTPSPAPIAPPTEAPVLAPIAEPTLAPQAVPVARPPTPSPAPIAAPTEAPVLAPITESTSAPRTAPVTPPVSFPTQPPTSSAHGAGLLTVFVSFALVSFILAN